MSTTQNDYTQLEDEYQQGGVSAGLNCLVQQLRSKQRYHELFEALKMKLRHELELPLLFRDEDNLPDPLRDKLESGLLDICREIGLSLLKQGKIRDGWMYLRPVGERQSAAEVIKDIEADDDNMDEMVEVLLHEGVDAARGFGLVLEHYGTCNSITTFEGSLQHREPDEQRAMAVMLLDHVHAELLGTLKADIAHQEDREPTENTLKELVQDRDWLFTEGSYHIDTTHLASTVRFSRILNDPAALRKALDLTEYGRRLNEQFQYVGDEPFTDIYPSNALYFQALLGENLDESLAYFADKAKTVDAHEMGTIAIETYVDLLSKIGRNEEAIQAAIELTPADANPIGVSPSLFELSEKAGAFDQYLEICKQRDDLLGFTTGLAHSQKQS